MQGLQVGSKFSIKQFRFRVVSTDENGESIIERIDTKSKPLKEKPKKEKSTKKEGKDNG
jgi:hypothetical protein